MKILVKTVALSLCITGMAFAQQLPPVQPPVYMNSTLTASELPPIHQVSSNPVVKLDAKAQRAVRLAEHWMNSPDMPVLGEDGTVTFVYGATLPQLVCKPLYACDVSLQPGERVKQVDVGDAVRWQVKPSISGAGSNLVTHLIIKPSESELSSNMFVTTDRRVYSIQLISKSDNWMPRVMFYYPDDSQTQWAAFYEKQDRQQKEERKLAPMTKEAEGVMVSPKYRLQGDKPSWRPLKVYADQEKTYIQFPSSLKNEDAPVLVVLGTGNSEQMVNYRILENRYVVDKVVSHAALISGVGRHQQKVEIVREDQ